MKKVLVTGSSGTLASYVKSAFGKEKLILTDRKNMDIMDEELVNKIIGKVKPDIILHLAAATNVDRCENDRQYSKINSAGTKNIVKAAKKNNAILVYISTSAVFDGSKKSYTELDSPNPINKYGKSKLQGENEVRKLENYYIMRLGWMIGGGKKEKKFLSHIYKQIKSGKKEIDAVSDLYGSITYAKDLADFLKKDLLKLPFGTYHFSSQETCTRFEMASYFVKKLRAKVKVNPVSSTIFSQTFFAPRPKYEVVRSRKIQYDFTWQQTLDKYIRNEFKKKKKN